ncbi:hypothetical protein ACFYZ8_41290 [Streptomyces sp. NPDC001668]|uniref:hypothetical protein n=1 Tax=unclassified Streptomyces TaxID=2593676 RepID=UPI00368E3054
MHVEVKGTTSGGQEVILTRAEVEKQRRYYPGQRVGRRAFDRLGSHARGSCRIWRCPPLHLTVGG